ncbi:hypothetical protein [Streptomyces sp. 8ZJF_21]|uniref:hypothetical protein n=1 Tax=Streptomyces sp. 8ZJF_21 TaxID=2903141 RepID=UPI001E46627C|nr:hypothetical protein [Streptomyces sp. 8ZJF_21]MCD9593277.1 hypothetical protein [Streptomyces sp. 8ZJF_21]
MNPRPWLDGYVQRNQVALARLREYTEDALAEVVAVERLVCPQPRRLPGEVIGMNVRNRVGLRATESVDFSAGTLSVRQVRNRGVRLLERGTGVELPLRKVKEVPSVAEWPGQVPQWGVQELLFDAPLNDDGLPAGLHPVLVWSMGKGDMLGGFSALIVDDLEDLDLATAFAAVRIDPGMPSAAGLTRPSSPPIGDDFEDVVRKVPQSAGEVGDTVTGA